MDYGNIVKRSYPKIDVTQGNRMQQDAAEWCGLRTRYFINNYKFFFNVSVDPVAA